MRLLLSLQINIFFVDHCGARTKVVAQLAPLVEKQCEEGGDEYNRKDPEESNRLQSAPGDAGQ
mgnify:CR=1 FL=1